MDINRLFKAGMKSCGRVLKVLPEGEIGSPNEYMMDVLQTLTLPSINELYPRLKRINIARDKLVRVDSSTRQMSGYVGYRIPMEVVNGLKIHGIKSYNVGSSQCSYDPNTGTTYTQGMGCYPFFYPNKYGRYSSANLYEAVTLAQLAYADMQLLGSVTEAPTPKFEPPNIIWINESYGNVPSYDITLLTDNDVNLISLPDHLFEGVKRLFILDIKTSIYDEYGILSNVDTPLGTIDLKIDDWASAEDQRKELYDSYDSLSHIRKTSIISG